MVHHKLSMAYVLAVLLPALAAPSAGVQGAARVEVGVLKCDVAGGSGFVFGSTKPLHCHFHKRGRDERYLGTISKFGIDVGTTQHSVIKWVVFAPTLDVAPGVLAGRYAGVSGEATVGVGVGANALIGGSQRSIVLQPLSVQAQHGLNVAVGVAKLTLEWRR